MSETLLLAGCGSCFLLVLVVAGVAIFATRVLQGGSSVVEDRPPGPSPTPPKRPAVPASSAVPAPGTRPQRQVQHADDGFWLFDPNLGQGSRVRYRCRTGSGWRQGVIAYRPGPRGHFVYTGERPSEVELVEEERVRADPTDLDSGAGGAFDSDADDADDILPAPQSLLDAGANADSGAGGDFEDAPRSSQDADSHTSLESGSGGSFGDPPAY